MRKELQEAKKEAMERHLVREEKIRAFKVTHKTEEMTDYIDIYIQLLNEIANYYLYFIETRRRKYLNLMKKSQELLVETAEEAVFDV